MLLYVYSFFLYVCVDICQDFHKIPYGKPKKPDTFQEVATMNYFENKSSDVCNFCYNKWNQSPVSNASEYTRFLYYSRETGLNYTEIFPGNTTSLIASGFNISKATKVLVHGWHDSGFIHFAALLREAYLNANDINIIIVDYSKMAYLFYPITRVEVQPIGRYLAELLDWLVADVGVLPKTLHLLGHSLGAHIAGVAGEHVTSGPLYRISGLDPAGPGFDSQKDGRLDASDGHFVDVIHTSGWWAGYYNPCGDVDFYPNGGIPNQPGCPLDWGKCSHTRSYKLFAESITNNEFIARACDGWFDYKRGLCRNNTEAFMGEYVDMSSSGRYYLKTAGQFPYALGG